MKHGDVLRHRRSLSKAYCQARKLRLTRLQAMLHRTLVLLQRFYEECLLEVSDE
jgi:hypothetical protein